MAGFKHRYLILKVRTASSQSFASTLRTILWNGIKEDFGDYVLSKIDYFEVCEYHDHLGIAIIRCNIDVYKYLCYVIVTQGCVHNMNIRMHILFVSGILKKAKKALLRYIKHGRLEAVKA